MADFEGMEPLSELAPSMSKVEGFIQRDPDDGEPASQDTEVYIGYDRSNLYAIWLAFDDEPELIRANLSSRENIGGDDRVGLTIDTFNDQRTALSFHATPGWEFNGTPDGQKDRLFAQVSILLSTRFGIAMVS
ncbi:MAG: hypothetical protein CM1200mP40_16750 [Gammaproteobacteria bacterium]|nr:MAG: hypothetical protein CM1200mP40_16750 [Gammaproteobacteria bacterium]